MRAHTRNGKIPTLGIGVGTPQFKYLKKIHNIDNTESLITFARRSIDIIDLQVYNLV